MTKNVAASSLNWDDLSSTPPVPAAPSDSDDPQADAIIAKMNASAAAGMPVDDILANEVADFGRVGRAATAETPSKARGKAVSWDDLSYNQPQPLDSDITAQQLGYPQIDNYAGQVYDSPSADFAKPDQWQQPSLWERLKAHPLDTIKDELTPAPDAMQPTADRPGSAETLGGVLRSTGLTAARGIALAGDVAEKYGPLAATAALARKITGTTDDTNFQAVDALRQYEEEHAPAAPVTAAEKRAAYAGNLLGGFGTMGMGAPEGEASDVIAHGGSLSDAEKALAIGAAQQEVSTGVGMAGRSLPGRVALQVPGNVAAGAAARALQGQDAGDLNAIASDVGSGLSSALMPNGREHDPAAEARRLADQTALKEGADIAQRAGDASGMTDAINQAREEAANAAETGQVAEDNQPQHPGDAEGGVPAETRGRSGNADGEGAEAPQVNADEATAHAAARLEALSNAGRALTDIERQEKQFLESNPSAADIARAYGLDKPEETNGNQNAGQRAGNGVDGAEEKAEAPQSIHADERNRQKAQALADSIPGLNDEQKQAIMAGYPKPAKDPLTGYDTRPELVPTIEAAGKSGKPAFYAEVDFRGLHPLNEHMGGQVGADPHMLAIVDGIARKELEAAGAEVAPNKKGGDEFGFTGTGIDAATAHDALMRAQVKADAYLKENGIDTLFNNRTGENVKTGIHFAATDVGPSDTAKSVLDKTDAMLAQRKRGAPYERPGANQEAGAGRGAGVENDGRPETAGSEGGRGAGNASGAAQAENAAASRGNASPGVNAFVARKALEKAFGASAVRKMEAAGLKITSGAELPRLAPDLPASEHGGVKGLTTPAGEPHVIHDQVPARELPGVVVHEIYHANAGRILSQAQREGIARRVEKLAEHSPKVRAALDSIPPGERNAGEKVAYALEHLQNQSLGRRALDTIKLGLNRLGVPLDWLNAHEAAVREIGQLNLRHFAESGEKTYQRGPDQQRFSRSYESAPDSLMGYKKEGPQTSYEDSNYKFHQPVRVTFENGDTMVDGMNGLNQPHAIERAYRNWKTASKIEPVSKAEYERANGEPYPVDFEEGKKLGGRERAVQFSRAEQPPEEPIGTAAPRGQFDPARAGMAPRGTTAQSAAPPAPAAQASATPQPRAAYTAPATQAGFIGNRPPPAAQPHPQAPQPPGTPARAASMVRMSDPYAVREAGRGAIREALAKRDLATAQADAGLDYFRRQYDNRPRAVITDPRQALQPIIDYQQGGLMAVRDPLTGAFMREAQRMIAQRTAKIQAIGQREGKPLLQTLRQNYFPQLWERDPKSLGWAQDYYRKSPMQGDRSFLKQRVFDDIEQGLNAGYTPISTNPVDLVMGKLWQMDKFIATHDMMHEMDNMGLLQDHPMDKPPPVGWGRINDYTFTGKIVPESVAKSLNNILDPGLNKYGWWRSARYVENAILSARMGLSAFHAGFTTFDTLVAHVADGLDRIARGDVIGAAKSIGKASVSPVASPIEGRRLLKQVLGQAAADPQTSAVLNALVSGGARVRMDPTDYNNAYAQFGRAMRQRDIGGMAKTAVPAVLEATTRYIMNSLVPYQKMSARVLMMKNELERAAGFLGTNPKDYAATTQAMNPVALRDMAGRVNQLVDDRLGQVAYDNRFWNSTAKHIAQALVQAPGWNVGTLNVVFKPLSDVAHIAKPERYAGPIDRAGNVDANRQRLSPRITYLAAAVGVTALYGAVRQYLATGQSPESFKDLMMPRVGGENPDGSPIREALPSYVKDMMEYANHPLTTAEHKLNPVLSMGAELLQNKDYFGNEIRNPHDSMLKQAGQLMSYLAHENLPYSVQNVVKSRESGKSTAEQLLPLIGVTQAPASVTRSKFQEAVAEGLGGSTFSRTPEQAAVANKVYTAENQIRMGLKPDLSQFDDKTRAKIERDTERPMMESRFKRLVAMNKQAALDAWEASTPEERKKFNLQEAMFPRGDDSKWEKYTESLDPDERVEVQKRIRQAYEWRQQQ